MRTPDLERLIVQARAGGASQLAALGKRMLVAAGVNHEGIKLLEEAAALGDGAAAAQLSVCAAWGIGMPRDIERALDFLTGSALLEWRPAQEELALLARSASRDWQEMRREIDIARLTAAPAIRVISAQPRILAIENFCSAQECAWLIERGRPYLERAQVYRGSSTAQVADSRTNTEMGFTIFRADVVLNLIRTRMAAVLNTSTGFFEVTKLLHYASGEYFGVHADFLQSDTPELVREIEHRGQRVATFLTYLNDDYRGGETDFPRLGYRHRGACGDALVFSNVDPKGAPDYSTVHAGLAVTTGEKWLLSQWIRSKPVG